MAINVPGTAQKLADDYTNLGAYIGLTTDDPGTTAPPAHEATGGDLIDWCQIPSTPITPGGGKILVTPQYAQS